MPLPLGTSALPAEFGCLRNGESSPSRQNLRQAEPLGTVCNSPRKGILRSSAVLDGHDAPRWKEVYPSRRLLVAFSRECSPAHAATRCCALGPNGILQRTPVSQAYTPRVWRSRCLSPRRYVTSCGALGVIVEEKERGRKQKEIASERVRDVSSRMQSI